MRAFIFLLIIVVLVVVAALATGFVNISQIRGGKVPQVSATGNGVTAKAGQAPAFDVQTGSVKVGAKQATVRMPSVVVQKPEQNQAAATNAM
jgi:hypothetical protein